MAAEIALCHHERWDGSGYPYGLRGASIPLSARVVTICDVYDALRSPRPYKAAHSHEATVAIMREGDGWVLPQHFDPCILKTFLGISDRFDEIYSGKY